MLNTIVNSPRIFAAQRGLVESANLVSTGNNDWENGVQFTPYGCYEIGASEAGCPGPEAGTPQECEPVATFMPYVLDLPLDWNALGPGDDPKYLASLHLEIGTSAILEKKMEVGTGGGSNFTLSDGTSLGAAVPAIAAVGQVENAFVQSSDHTGGGGTLYMAPSVAAQAFGILEEENQPYLRTKTLGSRVVIGNFDPGYVYGHIGEVDLYLGDINVVDTRDDYRANTYLVLAQRLGMAVWNPCATFKQAVSLPLAA